MMKGILMNQYILDRVEGNYAILEDKNGDMLKITIDRIDGSFKEGDILVKNKENFIVDEYFTKERQDKIQNMMKNIWE
ncbi:MAG: DUF3006 domain-containing protein [Clostridium butyricum]|nr:DUF3006 domain-containing protein [Clostridium butyricum]